MTPTDMIAGSIFKSKTCGDVEVIEWISSQEVIVRFVDTGTVVKTRSIQLRKSEIKDKNKPQVAGVGFIGDGIYTSRVDGILSSAYICWRNMLRRCYDEKYRGFYPTYADCSVATEWRNFQNFAAWHEENYPKDGGKYDLDKDIKAPGNRVYGPDTCMFVTNEVNNLFSQSLRQKEYSIVSPDGELVKFVKFKKFCRDNQLNEGSLGRLLCGKIKQHKGWTSAKSTCSS